MINWFAGTFAASLVAQIVKAAKFDEKSEYYKRIQNNPEFYGLIKKKLAESKTMSDLRAADETKNDEKDEKQDDIDNNTVTDNNNNNNDDDNNNEQNDNDKNETENESK